MPFSGSQPQYLPLSIDEGEQESSEKASAPMGHPPLLYRSGVLWLCIACTVVNVFTLFLNSRGVSREAISFSDKKDINTLRRPSQYIGFDTIPRPSPPVARNFTNFPFAAAQIDAGEPLKIFESDTKRYMALSGTVYPDGSKVIVSSKISTIVQFRAIDYGMEICELHINLPPSSVPAGQVEAISVYRLESSFPIDMVSLSYRTSPRRLGRIGDIRAVPDLETRWHHKMSCALEEVLTVELACPQDIPSGSFCNLEWWQPKEEVTPGIYIVQRATI